MITCFLCVQYINMYVFLTSFSVPDDFFCKYQCLYVYYANVERFSVLQTWSEFVACELQAKEYVIIQNIIHKHCSLYKSQIFVVDNKWWFEAGRNDWTLVTPVWPALLLIQHVSGKAPSFWTLLTVDLYTLYSLYSTARNRKWLFLYAWDAFTDTWKILILFQFIIVQSYLKTEHNFFCLQNMNMNSWLVFYAS